MVLGRQVTLDDKGYPAAAQDFTELSELERELLRRNRVMLSNLEVAEDLFVCMRSPTIDIQCYPASLCGLWCLRDIIIKVDSKTALWKK